jgi:hypothetical protein
MKITVEAGSARPTSTGVERGMDVRFDATIGDVELSGEVTLLPHEDGRRGFGRWGTVDNWLDGRTVATLRAMPDDVWSDALDAIATACGARCA